MPSALPFARLASFYALFFAVLGTLSPYWGPYLRSEGFDAAAIGTLIAIVHATKIVAPNLWGWVADVTGRRVLVIRLACFVALVAFTGVFIGDGFMWMALVMAAFSFFWNAALPQTEALTFTHLQDQTHRYPRIRLWGTVGFMVAVLLGGEAVDHFGAAIVPVIIGFALLALAVVSLTLPAAAARPTDRRAGSLVSVLRRPEVFGLFFACFLLQASHGPFYAFYSIYLQDYGYSGLSIGLLWAVALCAEIAVFMLMPRWLPRFGARRLLLITMALAILRWALVAFYPQWVIVQGFSQLLHAATYGIYHATAISLVNRYFTGSLQGRGQALYSSMTFGAGVALGSYLAGRLWDPLGGSMTFLLSAFMAGLALVAAAVLVRGESTLPVRRA